MANILATQFFNAYSNPKSILPSAYDIFSKECCPLSSIPLLEDDFIEAINLIKTNSSTDLLGFTPILLKRCKFSLAKPLQMLWSKSFQDGEIPLALKRTIITPIFKKGSKANPENYRPIASSSYLIKVFERVIRKYTMCYLEENHLLNSSQHGFRQNRSCLSQLLAHYETILHYIEEGLGVDVIYLDFAKAFDKVDFEVLLNKLRNLGIGGQLGRWFYSFLTNRTQCVSINKKLSNPIPVKSGVIQGSVLGPLLFLIMISDIDEDVFSSHLSSFADDTRIAHYISSAYDGSSLQSDLNAVYRWAEKNNMEFNNAKFELIRYNVKSGTDVFSYTSSNRSIIDKKSSIKDLGITLSENLNFSEHIENITSSIKKMSSWILRTFNSRSKSVMIPLWKSLVVPIHDYCSQLWSPTKTGDIQKLDLLQWYFMKKIIRNCGNDYWDSLNELKLYSFQRRRERYQIIYIWKIIENIVPNPSSNSLHHDNISNTISIKYSRNGRYCVQPTVTNRHCSAKLINQRNSSFSVFAPKLFNTLPRDIRNVTNCSIDVFKNKLDSFLQCIPDMPHLPGLGKFSPAVSNSLIHMIPVFA